MRLATSWTEWNVHLASVTEGNKFGVSLTIVFNKHYEHYINLDCSQSSTNPSGTNSLPIIRLPQSIFALIDDRTEHRLNHEGRHLKELRTSEALFRIDFFGGAEFSTGSSSAGFSTRTSSTAVGTSATPLVSGMDGDGDGGR